MNTPMTSALSERISPLQSRLRCPECRQSLQLTLAAQLHCNACQCEYPVIDGVPILLSSAGRKLRAMELSTATGRAMVSEYQQISESPEAATKLQPRRRRWLEALRPPAVMWHPNPQLDAPSTRKLFDHAGSNTIVLNVGGGPTRYSAREITLNLEAFLNVDLVGDAHNIPLEDASVDTVICNAVLEHVHDSEKVAAELMRVLKPGGLLYAEVPFIFFFHGYPNDFKRYTREGLRRLFSGLDSAEIGISGGPMSALLQTGNMVLQMFVPRRTPRLRKAVNGVYRWIVFPLKHLDRWLNQRPDAHLVAGGFYVFGRKPVDARQEASA